MKHSYTSSKGNFFILVRQQHPREELKDKDPRGLRKTRMVKDSLCNQDCIGFAWSPDGDFDINADPKVVYENVLSAMEKYAVSYLHHNNFYDVKGKGELKLAPAYTGGSQWEGKEICLSTGRVGAITAKPQQIFHRVK